MEDKPQVKRCLKCGEVKTVEEFSQRKDRNGRPTSQCKICAAFFMRELRKTDKAYRERGLIAHREWTRQNREKINIYKKTVYWKDPEKHRAKQRDYNKTRRGYMVEKSKQWAMKNPERRKAQARSVAKRAADNLASSYLRNCLKKIYGINIPTINQIQALRECYTTIRKFRELREELHHVSMDGNLQ